MKKRNSAPSEKHLVFLQENENFTTLTAEQRVNIFKAILHTNAETPYTLAKSKIRLAVGLTISPQHKESLHNFLSQTKFWDFIDYEKSLINRLEALTQK